MNKINLADASPSQLNWLVAICKGAVHVQEGDYKDFLHWAFPAHGPYPRWVLRPPDYVGDWHFGGPLLVEMLTTGHVLQQMFDGQGFKCWRRDEETACVSYGTTPMLAVAREFIASVLGSNEAEVPEYLL